MKTEIGKMKSLILKYLDRQARNNSNYGITFYDREKLTYEVPRNFKAKRGGRRKKNRSTSSSFDKQTHSLKRNNSAPKQNEINLIQEQGSNEPLSRVESLKSFQQKSFRKSKNFKSSMVSKKELGIDDFNKHHRPTNYS